MVYPYPALSSQQSFWTGGGYVRVDKPRIRSNTQPARAQFYTEAHEVQHPLGHLKVVPLEEVDIKAAAVLLSRSFSSQEWQSLDNVIEYLTDMLSKPPAALAMAGRLYPSDPEKLKLPKGKDYRVVGTASVAMTDETCKMFAGSSSIPVPNGAAYLSNMAVDTNFRRQKIGTHMLDACTSFVKQHAEDMSGICLHVRAVNTAASTLYEQHGYCIVKSDPFYKFGAIEHLMYEPLE